LRFRAPSAIELEIGRLASYLVSVYQLNLNFIQFGVAKWHSCLLVVSKTDLAFQLPTYMKRMHKRQSLEAAGLSISTLER
jgi:hypothetical protein